MRKYSRFIMSLAICCIGTLCAFAQQFDPLLTGAVTAQIPVIEQIHDKRSKLQEQIIFSQAAVTAAVEKVHDVEKKMLSYLSNAQGAMQNLYQIKRVLELAGKEIPNNFKLLSKSVPKNLEGTFITAIISNKKKDIYNQIASLVPFMTQLVESGTYNVPDGKGGNEKHKVNLLNSAERYYIANEVLFRLEAINTDIYIMAWQIRCMSWHDLWFKLDPASWCMVYDSKNIANQIISDWKRLL